MVEVEVSFAWCRIGLGFVDVQLIKKVSNSVGQGVCGCRTLSLIVDSGLQTTGQYGSFRVKGMFPPDMWGQITRCAV